MTPLRNSREVTTHRRRHTRRTAGAATLGSYRLLERVRSKVFSVMAAGAFDSFGPRSVIVPPIRIQGEEHMAIGGGVYIGAGSWLQVIDDDSSARVTRSRPALVIGDGTRIAGACVISAAVNIVLGRQVLLARNVYIADHGHAFHDPSRAVLDQGIRDLSPVRIGDGAWLGQNVVVMPGVTIGAGAVIGANAVVTHDVPPRTIAAGVPAQVLRRLSSEFEHAAARTFTAHEDSAA
jgi:acetyltransferase-like isoleucine patch superfamily enzyme